mmetsp:Transcript_3344/g.5079  ORF Transcript_3344/g.5079 Transcript_3344/m.5079 type:complete len:515 (+) Transcript_3344:49-1593(+)
MAALCIVLFASMMLVPNMAAHASPITSLSRDLTYDENNRLAEHALVFVDSPACEKVDIAAPAMIAGFNIISVDGAARNEIFREEDTELCQASCIERGVERSLAGSILEHKYYDGQDFDRWFNACRKVEVCFMNYHDRERPIKSYWVNFEGGQQPHQPEILYGERNTKCFTSFVGHKFVIKDADDNLIQEFKVEFNAVIGFGTSPPSDVRDPDYVFENEVKSTLHNEWKRHNRVTRTFSPLGFKKGRLPPDVFASMGAFYYNNRNNLVREEWKHKGVFVNWWETDVKFVQIPWSLKEIWQKRLLTLVEAWAGVPVEQTVIYGLRHYTSGARLLSHVDRHETHAVSLIVNVAQGILTEPWPVEVQDHEDRMHEVLMEPGDIVYYESAKCLHARNRPMKGDNAYYVNLFTHYKPVDGKEWWHESNHEGTPEPVGAVDGSCKLVRKGTSSFGDGGLGFVSGVECDDPRLGSFVSPTFFQAKGPEDMIQWWKQTSPDYKPNEEMNQSHNIFQETSHEEL